MKERKRCHPAHIDREYITNLLKSSPGPPGVVPLKHKVAAIHPHTSYIETDKLCIILRKHTCLSSQL
jgi:hypothetical protein